MTQTELAEALGYKSKSSINKIELGKQELTQKKIKAVADALNTTASYIMGWDDAHFNLVPAGLSIQDVAYELGIPQEIVEDMVHGEAPAESVEKISFVANLLAREATCEKLGISRKEWDLLMLYRAASEKDKAVVNTVLGYHDE